MSKIKISKTTLLKGLASVIQWLTKGKVEKNTVLAIGGVVLATMTALDHKDTQQELNAWREFREQVQEQMIVIDTPSIQLDTIKLDSLNN